MLVIKPCPGINIGYGTYGRDPDPWDDWDDYEKEDDDEDEEEDCEGE